MLQSDFIFHVLRCPENAIEPLSTTESGSTPRCLAQRGLAIPAQPLLVLLLMLVVFPYAVFAVSPVGMSCSLCVEAQICTFSPDLGIGLAGGTMANPNRGFAHVVCLRGKSWSFFFFCFFLVFFFWFFFPFGSRRVFSTTQCDSATTQLQRRLGFDQRASVKMVAIEADKFSENQASGISVEKKSKGMEHEKTRCSLLHLAKETRHLYTNLRTQNPVIRTVTVTEGEMPNKNKPKREEKKETRGNSPDRQSYSDGCILFTSGCRATLYVMGFPGT